MFIKSSILALLDDYRRGIGFVEAVVMFLYLAYSSGKKVSRIEDPRVSCYWMKLDTPYLSFLCTNIGRMYTVQQNMLQSNYQVLNRQTSVCYLGL